jgi:hypothetical protein
MNPILKTITPLEAEAILKSANTRNRPMRMHHVRSLAEDMKEKRWLQTGETIVFDKMGRLVDGQHRLLAVVIADVSVTFLVVYGVEPESFEVMDRGIPRTIADRLVGEEIEDASRLASVAKHVITLSSASPFNTYRSRLNPQLTIEFIRQNKARLSEANRKTQKVRLIPSTACAGLYFLFSQKDQPMADVFVDSLLMNNDSIPNFNLLRGRLVQNATSRAKLSVVDILHFAVKAWNAHRGNSRIGKLRIVKGEAFPKIV